MADITEWGQTNVTLMAPSEPIGEPEEPLGGKGSSNIDAATRAALGHGPDHDDRAAEEGWGWGWGGVISAVSAISEGITRTAQETVQEASRSFAELQQSVVESMQPEEGNEQTNEGESSGARAATTTDNPVTSERGTQAGAVDYADEEGQRRKAALDRLENAGEDSILGQGFKALDSSMESLAQGAYNIFDTAVKGSLGLAQRLEAEGLVDPARIRDVAGGLVKSTEGVLTRGTTMVGNFGKQYVDMLAKEAGVLLEDDEEQDSGRPSAEDVAGEEVTFERCFYIYGGPEHLEELETLSNHHAVVVNRARAKLSRDEKGDLDSLLLQLQEVLSLDREEDEAKDGAKGMEQEDEEEEREVEIRSLREAGLSEAARMAQLASTALVGTAPITAGEDGSSTTTSPAPSLTHQDTVTKMADRLESIRGEGVHRLSEFCALCINHVLLLGQSAVLSAPTSASASTLSEGAGRASSLKVQWPEGVVDKARLVQRLTKGMAQDVEALEKAFSTAISDVARTFEAAAQTSGGGDAGGGAAGQSGGGVGGHSGLASWLLKGEKPMRDYATELCGELESDYDAAVMRLQDGLMLLAYPLLSTTLQGQ